MSNQNYAEDDAAVSKEHTWEKNEVHYCGISVHKNTVTCIELFLLLVITLLVGGGIFHVIEHPNELIEYGQIEAAYDADYHEIKLLLSNAQTAGNWTATFETYEKLQVLAAGFDDRPTLLHKWDFSKACLFCFTIVTTIGYGTFAPTTPWGQMFLVFYSLVGIPVAGLSLGYTAERILYFFTWLSKVGQDKVELAFNHFDEDGSGELDQNEFSEAVRLLGFNLSEDRFRQLWNQIDSDGGGMIDIEEFRKTIQLIHADVTETAGQKSKLYITILLILIWVAIGTVVLYYVEENWRVINTVYFLFVSLTTVGLGDVFPETNIGRSFLILFCLVGLGLLAILIKLLENIFGSIKQKK